MAQTEIQPGDRVSARNAFGEHNERIALTTVIEGEDFPVVWVCSEAEWDAARIEGREPDGSPWPAEDVSPLVSS